MIANSDASEFAENTLYCDGSRYGSSVTQLWCSLPVKAVLMKAPFLLEFDDLVQIRVQAKNSRGWSDFSDLNTDGARIQSEPLFMAEPERDD
jgi:hypothetical protein